MEQMWTFSLEDKTVTVINTFFKEQLYLEDELVAKRKSFIPTFSSELSHVVTSAVGEEQKIVVKIKAATINVKCETSVNGKAVKFETNSIKFTSESLWELFLFTVFTIAIGGIIGFVLGYFF